MDIFEERMIPSISNPENKGFDRAEMDEMVARWLQANKDAEQAGDWTKHLGPMYTEDAVYEWNIGPNEQFRASNRKEICEIALGYQMSGFEDWQYPYHDIIIDTKRGTVIGFWKQVAPYERADGTPGSSEEFVGELRLWKLA